MSTKQNQKSRTTALHSASGFSQTGRIGRAQYLNYHGLIAVVGAIVITPLLMFEINPVTIAGLVIVVALVLIRSIDVAIRRFKDCGKSASWAWLTLLPGVNLLVHLWLAFQPGESRTNLYGPPPKPPSELHVTLACFWLLAFAASLIFWLQHVRF